MLITAAILSAAAVSGKEIPPATKAELRGEIAKIENRIQKSDAETATHVESLKKQFGKEIEEQTEKIAALENDIRGIAGKLDEIAGLILESKDGFDRSIIGNQDLLRRELEIKGLEIAKTAASVEETQKRLEKMTGRLAGEVESRDAKHAEILNEIKMLKGDIRRNADGLAETRNEFSKVNRNVQDKFRDISGTVSRGTLHWIAAVFAVAFLSLVFFIVLKKNISKKAGSLDNRIRDTKEALAAEAIRLDARLVDLLQAGLGREGEPGDTEPDHSFYLKTGLEIHRMRKRIENMSENARGLKALKQSLDRLEKEYIENGYEIIDLTGRPFVEGMTAVARFVPSDGGKTGGNIITRVIKPQINYNGILIQPAEIEVGNGD